MAMLEDSDRAVTGYNPISDTREIDGMSAKQRELVALAMLSAMLSVVASYTDHKLATFIFTWFMCGAVFWFESDRYSN
jgi:hypothetical protein